MSYIIVLAILVLAFDARAQIDPKTICRLDDNLLVFKLDHRWTNGQKKEVIRLFDLDSALLADAFGSKTEIVLDKVTWKIRKIDNNLVEVSKPMDNGSSYGKGDIYMLDDRWINAAGIEERESDAFGVNVFSLYSIFNYNKGEARFYLPNRKYASHVYLSGSFNNWSTMQTPMIRCDSGWIITLSLKPGKYTYKYIIDGQWTRDPYNKLSEDDSQGGGNSVVYCYNYRFFLPFYKTSKKVYVAGSFNNWNPSQIRMQAVKGGWAVNLFLREGTHAYKFIVDGEWFLDPGNDVFRPDGMGHKNSFLSIGDTMFFVLNGHSAIKHVHVAGNFNAWNPEELSMLKLSNGWKLPYVLAPGNYEYKFILDGRWITDPDNQYTVGKGSSENSFLAVKPNHLFTLAGFAGARKVLLSGSFNGWNKDGYEMIIRNDVWVFPLYLKPGKHTYKFIVDGKWINDPGNELWENNEYGTGNSVLWIEP